MINKERLIILLRRLIRIRSENPPGNEVEIASFVKRYLEGFGLKGRIYNFAKNRSNIVALLKADSPGAKTILISPHLDTVPAGRGWKFAPFAGIVRKGRVYGRGATDCKCNLAVAMEALNSLVEGKVRIENNILFAATADEESGSDLGLAPLLKKDILKADYALILDADEFDVVIAQKGLVHFKVFVCGRKAHGAYPWKGVNAINIAAAIIKDLEKYKFRYKKHPLLRQPTVSIGTIRGGDKVNIVADWCEFEVDLRYLPAMDVSAVMSDFKKLIGAKAKSFKIRVDGLQGPYEIPGGHCLVSSLFAVWRKYQPKVKLKGSEGATVITFFKEKNIPAVATGFGSHGCAHINDEYVKTDNLFRGAKALEDFLLRKAC